MERIIQDHIDVLPGEQWVEISLNPDYWISSFGRVFSWKSKFTRYKPFGLLKPSIDNIGYANTTLVTPPYKNKRYKIHRLVALHFVDNPQGLNEVHHIDHDKLNNHYTNLRWVTHKENILLSYSEGNREIKRGPDHHRYGKKVSKETVQKLREAKRGERHPKFKGYYQYDNQNFASCQELADHLGTYPQAVYRLFKQGKIIKKAH